MAKPSDITNWYWKYYKRNGTGSTYTGSTRSATVKWYKPDGSELYDTNEVQYYNGGTRFMQSGRLLVVLASGYDNLEKTRYYWPSISSGYTGRLNLLDSGVYCKFLENITDGTLMPYLANYGLFFKHPGVSSIPIAKNESPFTSAAQFYNCTMEYGNSQSADVEPSNWYSTYDAATIGAEGTWYQWIRAKTTNGSQVMYHPILLGTSVIVVANSPFSVNVNGEFKQVAKTFANVGGVWKEISEIRANVGGTWK